MIVDDIELLAKAMCEAFYPDGDWNDGLVTWDTLAPRNRDAWRRAARAAMDLMGARVAIVPNNDLSTDINREYPSCRS